MFRLLAGRAILGLESRATATATFEPDRPGERAVDHPDPLRTAHPARPRLAVGVVAALILVGIVWAVGTAPWTAGGSRAPTPGRPRVRDVYADSPYQNTRPGVAYVGDEACARCHREIAEAYRGHPMGRSLGPVGVAEDGPPIGGDAGLPFESQGVQYTIERRDGRMFHKAWRRGPDGGAFAEAEAEVRYALGSGTRGITYLVERDGFLMQSPIAWFAQQRRWDISPGYGGANPRPSFERAIQRGCLFCHANQVHSASGTLNRYEPPIFQGHAIGCERCHGPGALHANGGRVGRARPDDREPGPPRPRAA